MIYSADESTFPAKYKQVFKRLVMSVCSAMWGLVSPVDQHRVHMELSGFLPAIDRLEGLAEVAAAAGGFLLLGHSLVDDTEAGMLAVLEAHSRAHGKRRRVAEEK